MRQLLALVVIALAVSSAAAAGARSGAPGPAALTFTRHVGQRESVWVAAADGSHPREVTANGYGGALSADGRWLTFERPRSQPDPTFFNLLFLDLTTGMARPLGKSSGTERWAPIGARLVVSQPGGLFTVDVTTGRRTRLLTTHVASLDFAPDARSIVFAVGSGAAGTLEQRSDLYMLSLRSHALLRLTHDGHSESPLVSRTGIAYVRFKNAYAAPETWLMRRDGTGKRLLARCCESISDQSHGDATRGVGTVALSADGKELLACFVSSIGCDPLAIDLPSGRTHRFPSIQRLASPQETASAFDLTRDGRTILFVVGPPKEGTDRRRLYAVPFAGGKPTLLVRVAAEGRWRR